MTRVIISDKDAIRDHIQGLICDFEARLQETYDCEISGDKIEFQGSDEFYKEHLQSIIKHQEDEFDKKAISAFHMPS